MSSMSATHVSVVSRERAMENIHRKIRLLDQWIDEGKIPWKETDEGKQLRDGEGELVVEWFPRNIVELARWTGSENSAPVRRMIAEAGGFDSFGRSTLDRAGDLKTSALRALRHVRLLAERQVESSCRGTVIDGLRLKVAAEQARTAQALRQYVETLAAIEGFRRDLALEQRLRAADVERLTGELNAARAENARLIARLRESESLYLAGGSDAQPAPSQ